MKEWRVREGETEREGMKEKGGREINVKPHVLCMVGSLSIQQRGRPMNTGGKTAGSAPPDFHTISC